jgi:AraC-like DNA-binding protein
MFLSLISLLVGFVVIILVPILFLRKRTDQIINPYLFLLFAFGGGQRFINGLVVFEIIKIESNPLEKKLWVIYIMIALHYLFFKNLFLKKTSLLNDLKFLIVPLFLIILVEVFDFDNTIRQIIFFVYSTFHLVLIISMIFSRLFNEKNKKERFHFDSIKNWVLIMFILTAFKYVFANFLFNAHLGDSTSLIKTEYFKYSSFIWIIIIIYIFRNPVILYGNQFLIKKIDKITLGDIKIWKKSKTLITAKHDLELERRVRPEIERMLSEIKMFEDNLIQNFKQIPSLKELSAELKYPESHIKYIFKYYSYFSFYEYQNALKIKYATQLIKSGYLELKTIDSLWAECLFVSRMTFYNNFKKLTGYSVSAYKANTTEK